MDHDASEDVLRNIKRYAEKARKGQIDAMEVEQQSTSATETRLASTIEELQRRLEQRQTELERVRILKPRRGTYMLTLHSLERRSLHQSRRLRLRIPETDYGK